jgi:hypothetical protein
MLFPLTSFAVDNCADLIANLSSLSGDIKKMDDTTVNYLGTLAVEEDGHGDWFDQLKASGKPQDPSSPNTFRDSAAVLRTSAGKIQEAQNYLRSILDDDIARLKTCKK